MKKIYRYSFTVVLAFIGLLGACAEPGKSGEDGLDCGAYGSAHGEHCHCNEGYLFDGETCVSPDDIGEECAEHEDADGGDADTDESEHAACRCPLDGECPCEGEVLEYGGREYCIPPLHEA